MGRRDERRSGGRGHRRNPRQQPGIGRVGLKRVNAGRQGPRIGAGRFDGLFDQRAVQFTFSQIGGRIIQIGGQLIFGDVEQIHFQILTGFNATHQKIDSPPGRLQGLEIRMVQNGAHQIRQRRIHGRHELGLPGLFRRRQVRLDNPAQKPAPVLARFLRRMDRGRTFRLVQDLIQQPGLVGRGLCGRLRCRFRGRRRRRPGRDLAGGPIKGSRIVQFAPNAPQVFEYFEIVIEPIGVKILQPGKVDRNATIVCRMQSQLQPRLNAAQHRIEIIAIHRQRPAEALRHTTSRAPAAEIAQHQDAKRGLRPGRGGPRLHRGDPLDAGVFDRNGCVHQKYPFFRLRRARPGACIRP